MNNRKNARKGKQYKSSVFKQKNRVSKNISRVERRDNKRNYLTCLEILWLAKAENEAPEEDNQEQKNHQQKMNKTFKSFSKKLKLEKFQWLEET